MKRINHKSYNDFKQWLAYAKKHMGKCLMVAHFFQTTIRTKEGVCLGVWNHEGYGYIQDKRTINRNKKEKGFV